MFSQCLVSKIIILTLSVLLPPPLLVHDKSVRHHVRLTLTCWAFSSFPLLGTLSCQFYSLSFFPIGLNYMQVSPMLKANKTRQQHYPPFMPYCSAAASPFFPLNLLPILLKELPTFTVLISDPNHFSAQTRSTLPHKCLSLRFNDLAALDCNGHWSVFKSLESVVSQ